MQTSRFAWQDEFVDAWNRHTSPNFFLCALPGAGKTRAAIRAARLWIEKGGVVVVVSPSRPLKRHWRSQFQKFKVYLDTNFYGYVREGYSGVSTTYSGISGQSLVFRKLCHDHPVLLICDEIHHASEGENSKWGTDLCETFYNAKKRLLLSGTPVRSDKETTSFLEFEQFVDEDGITRNRYKAHFSYDWPRALADKVVRSLIFHRQSMDTVDVEYASGKKTLSSDDDAYLGYALDHLPFILSILTKANEKLKDLRRTDPSAAAIVVCKDIAHAHKVYDVLRTLGEDPVVVTTNEDEDSTDVIDDFRDTESKRWIVSVRQVSEGVDITRLRVLAYLTNYLTDLAFRQIVGRIVRRRDNETDAEAQGHAFIPEVPKLVRHAEKIEQLQALAFKKKNGGDPGIGPTGGILSGKGFVVDGSEPYFVGYTIHGNHFEGDRASVIHQLMKKYKINEESASLMLDDATPIGMGEVPEGEVVNEEPPWVQEDLLKIEIKGLVKELVKVRRKNRNYPEDYDAVVWRKLESEIHFEFMERGTPQGELTAPQLQRKKDNLRRAIFNERVE